MKINDFITLIICLIPSLSAFSQTSDWGMWTNAGTDFPLYRKLRMGVDLEYRRNNNIRSTDQIIASADINYRLHKYAKASLGYEFIACSEADVNPFAYYHRYKFRLPLSYSFMQFSIGWRPQLQVDVEASRNFAETADCVMRNRFQLKYAISSTSLKPYMSIELFNRLFNPSSASHYKDRIAAGMEYCINPAHSFAIGYMIEPRYSRKPVFHTNVIQAGYLISF
jgi:hypothetical protein